MQARASFGFDEPADLPMGSALPIEIRDLLSIHVPGSWQSISSNVESDEAISTWNPDFPASSGHFWDQFGELLSKASQS